MHFPITFSAIRAAIIPMWLRRTSLFTGKSALALQSTKVLTKGWESGQTLNGQTMEVSVQAQFSPPSEPRVLLQLEAVPFLGMLTQPELELATKSCSYKKNLQPIQTLFPTVDICISFCVLP